VSDHARKIAMTDPVTREHLSLPVWFKEELAKASVPTDEEVERLAYTRADFLAAMRSQAQQPEAVSSLADRIDAVFSITGRLLSFAVGVEGAQLCTCPAYAATGTRGSRRITPRAQPTEADVPVWVVGKPLGELRLEARTRGTPGGAVIGFNVISADDASEIRPFTVTVIDETESVVAGPDTWQQGDHPSYPEPEAGVYEFRVEVAGQKGVLCLEFRLENVGD